MSEENKIRLKDIPPKCSQCGEVWSERACGPYHAMLGHVLRIAAGKKLCGMCGWKAPNKGEWRCRSQEMTRSGPYDVGYICPVPNPMVGCLGFIKKPSCIQPTRPKKKRQPATPGVKFLYVGRPPGGVVTVAYSITERVPLVEMAFSFCSPKDRWHKGLGRDMAVTRLRNSPITVPYIYSPERTVHEVVRGVLSHDFQRLERLIPGMKAWGHCRVPSWTKDLAKRVEGKEITAAEINRRMGRPKRWRPEPTHTGDAFAFMAPGFKTNPQEATSLAKLAIKAVPGAPIDMARKKEAAYKILRNKTGRFPHIVFYDEPATFPIPDTILARILSDIAKLR